LTITQEQRRRIRAQAGGCCEYCRIGTGEQSADFHIDHIIAISHGGEDFDQNLCPACLDCNSFKGVNVAAIDPQTDKPSKLFHPRLQIGDDHFRINPDASIFGLTPEGRTTAAVLRINDEARVEQRYGEALLGNYPCQNKP